MRYKNNLVPLIIGITIFITGLLLFVDPLTRFFEFETLDVSQLSISIATGLLFVVWYEFIKWGKRISK